VTVNPVPHRTVATDSADSSWHRWSTEMHAVVSDPGLLVAARAEIDAELDAAEAAASRFRPDSELSMLATAAGRPTRISPLLAELLDAALRAAARTNGDVDPTVGAALIALGYDRDWADVGDDPARIGSVTVAAHWSMVRLHDRVVQVPDGVLLDLGATAKALTADRCARRVHRATGTGVLVNLGGDIATAGLPPEGGWRVLVRDDDAEPESSIVLTSGTGLATSSTIRRRWRRGEGPIHHILDPRTCSPAEPVWRTVTVAAPTCLDANTISTAAVVRGWAALPWIRDIGVPARLVDQDRVVHTVGGWPAQTDGAPR
jgi:thiamine biosynthesis lipoprotein